MIESERIQGIAAVLLRAGLNDQTLAVLRESIPDLHFSLCSDDDVCGCPPVHQEAEFNLYLVDGRAHCLTLTTDQEAATGLLIAQVDD